MDKITGKPLEIIAFLMGDNADKKATYDLTLHQDNKKRSLSQNAYYWKLLEQMAVKSHIAKAELHNINLRHLALISYVADKPVYVLLPDTDEVEKQTLLAETYHLAPRRETKVGNDGITYRWYVMLRGSSEMNVQEMNALLSFAVQDAKAMGIEVLTPDELEHMKELELAQEKRKAEKNNI